MLVQLLSLKLITIESPKLSLAEDINMSSIFLDNISLSSPLIVSILFAINIALLVFVILIYNKRKRSKSITIDLEQKYSNLNIINESDKIVKNLYETIFNESHDIIFVIKGGKLNFFNNRLSEYTGYSHDELIEMEVVDLLIEDMRPRFTNILKEGKLIPTKGKPFKLRLLSKEGRKLYFDVEISEIYYGGENIHMGFAEDVTRVVLKDKQLKKYLAELEIANLTKDRFLSIIGHDLKNPINVIMGLSELTYSSYNYFNEDELKDNLKTIYEATDNAYQLLENLLKWSRAQQGRLDFNPIPCLVSDMVNEITAPIKVHAESKSITIHTSIQENLVVPCDRDMMLTAIRNLISNAIKFSENNSNIYIEAIELYGKFIIKVRDEGIGISEKNLSELFNIENQARKKGTAKEEGTGLGLLLTKEFVEIHQGDIKVESRINEGSTFIISLPLK